MKRRTVRLAKRAQHEIGRLPGYVRQRVVKAIKGLATVPAPRGCKRMRFEGREVYRIKMDKWRIVYVIDNQRETIHVLTVRPRPPYDYADLETMVKEALGEEE